MTKLLATTFVGKKVKLTEVQGDQIEFADLLGKIGVLLQGERENDSLPGKMDSLCFHPEGRTDWLAMTPTNIKKYTKKIIIDTKMGNTFTFKLVE